MTRLRRFTTLQQQRHRHHLSMYRITAQNALLVSRGKKDFVLSTNITALS
jgi:hypothetical protein